MNSVFGINSFTGLYAGTNTPDLAATAETTATDWTKGIADEIRAAAQAARSLSD